MKMGKKPKRYLQFKASTKYNEADEEWCCSSSLPEITGEPCNTIDEAIDSYEGLLHYFLKDKFGINPGEVKRAEKKISCKDASFPDEDDPSVLSVDLVDLRVSLTYRIVEKVNRELSEFEPEEMENISPKVREVYNKIVNLSLSTGLEPDAILTAGMLLVEQRKEAAETA